MSICTTQARLFALTIVALAVVCAGDALASRRQLVSASAFYVLNVNIASSATTTFATTKCSPSADPVFHLLRQSGATWTQVAYNDDYPGQGVNSRIAFTNSHPSITSFRLVMRRYGTTPTGTCDVTVNGVTHQGAAPVGGTMLSAASVTFQSGNTAYAISVPGGSTAPTVFTFWPNDTTIVAAPIANGPAMTGNTVLSGGESHFLVGTPHIRSGSVLSVPRSGQAHLNINDANAGDADGDGLGDGFEIVLGTCSSTTACPSSPHGRDTDRDGLPDGAEILGVVGNLGNGSDDLALPRFGANVLQKDAFVEVDHYSLIPKVPTSPPDPNPFLPPNTNPFQALRNADPAQPEQWVADIQTAYTTPIAAASHLKNPNQVAGQPTSIRVHLDLGVAPTNPLNEASFGIFGGASSRIYQPDLEIFVSRPVTGNVRVQVNGVSSSWFSATGFSTTELAALIGFAALGVSSAISVPALSTDPLTDVAKLTVATSTVGVAFTMSIEVPAGEEDAVRSAFVEESAWIDYDSTPAQFDEVRRGLFRYARVFTMNHGGSAWRASLRSGMTVSGFRHELGHTMDLEHYGHPNWGNAGPNCVPHYRSLMSYINGVNTFSATEAANQLNPNATREQNTFNDPNFAVAGFASGPFNYAVDTTPPGSIDWNRDGAAEASATTYQTMALSVDSASCRAFALGSRIIDPAANVSGPVDLVRSGNRIYALWAQGGTAILYKRAMLGSTTNKMCTGATNPTAGDCLTWEPGVGVNSIPTLATPFGVSALAVGNDIFVAYRDANNALHVERRTPNATGILVDAGGWTMPSDTSARRSAFTPELVELHDLIALGQPGLLYLAQDGVFRLRRFDATSNTWGDEVVMELDDGGAGASITGSQAPSAKGWPGPQLAWNASERRTIAVLPGGPDSKVRIYVLNQTNRRWTAIYDPTPAVLFTHDKPFLEYRAIRFEDGQPDAAYRGHLMVGYSFLDPNATPPSTRAMFRLSTLISRQNPPQPGFALQSVGDFLWDAWKLDQPKATASLYSDPTFSSVFGLVALSPANERGLNFYPFADGSPNQTFTVRSDWRVMEDYLCVRLQDRGGIACGPPNVLD